MTWIERRSWPSQAITTDLLLICSSNKEHVQSLIGWNSRKELRMSRPHRELPTFDNASESQAPRARTRIQTAAEDTERVPEDGRLNDTRQCSHSVIDCRYMPGTCCAIQIPRIFQCNFKMRHSLFQTTYAVLRCVTPTLIRIWL